MARTQMEQTLIDIGRELGRMNKILNSMEKHLSRLAGPETGTHFGDVVEKSPELTEDGIIKERTGVGGFTGPTKFLNIVQRECEGPLYYVEDPDGQILKLTRTEFLTRFTPVQVSVPVTVGTGGAGGGGLGGYSGVYKDGSCVPPNEK